MANNQLLASDNFASGSLAAGWSAAPTMSACKVVAGSPNVTESNATSVNSGQVWTGLTWPNDQSSEVTIQALASESVSLVALWVRMQNGVYSAYQCNIGMSFGDAYSASVYKIVSGSATQIGSTVDIPGISAGDVFTFSVAGCCLTLYQNGGAILYENDATFASGTPGYSQYSTVDVTHTQVSAWRGYSAVQQDGVWQKQGIAFPAIASELVQTHQRGTQNIWIIQNDTNPIIFTGQTTINKAWFGSGEDTAYAESIDGKTWTRYSGNPVITGFGITPCVVKDPSTGTYHAYVVPGDETGGLAHYTSSDGVTFSQISTDTFPTSGSNAGPFFFYVFDISGGVWTAMYLSTITLPWPSTTSLATSTDGSTWAAYAGNPIISNFWGAAPVKVGDTWYAWGATVNPGAQEATRPGIDPYETARVQSTDKINWTNRVHSIHHSQAYESLNLPNGGGYGGNVFDMGGKAFMYCGSETPDDLADIPTYQIGLAIAPVSIAQLVTQPEDALSQTATDDFTSGVGDLSSNWVTPPGLTKLQIVSGNLVEGTETSVDCGMLYTGAAFGDSQYSTIITETLSATTQYAQPIVRGQLGANSFYSCSIQGPTGSAVSGAVIFKVVDGATTLLGPSATMTLSSDDAITLSVATGSDGFPVLSLFQNGFLILQVQDFGNSLTSGYPGIVMYATTLADAQISGWSGGNANQTPNYGGTAWSPVDCRDYATFPNTGIVQPSQAVFYIGQTSSNSAVPGVDSREAGASVDSRTVIPQNSRNAPPF